MAIQHRRGNIADFDPNKMVVGEWAFPSDGTARCCVEPGNVKTVATKEELQAILDSSPEAYTALQQLIADLQDNPSELTNILNHITDLYSQLSKKATYYDLDTQTGTTLNYTNAEDAVVEIAKIEGASSQLVTQTGKNILPKTKKTVAETISGITFTPNADGSVTLNGAATANAQFFLFGSTSSTQEILGLQAGSYTLKATGVSNVSVNYSDGSTTQYASSSNTTFSPTAKYSVNKAYISVLSGAVLSNLIVYPQLEAGTSSTAYAAFVPNSPSVDYPAPITSAGDTPFDVVACWKNLNSGIEAGGYDTTTGLKVTNTSVVRNIYPIYINKNNSYVFKNNTQTTSGNMRVFFYDSAGKHLGNLSKVMNGTVVFLNSEFPSNTAYINYNAANTVVALTDSLQLEVGSIATTYEAYKSNKINISLPHRSIPSTTIKDIITSTNTGFLKHTKYISKKTMTATGAISDAKSGGYYFSNITGVGTLSGTTFTMPSGATSVDVYYQLATPIETILSTSCYLTSYQGITNVFTTASPQVAITAAAKSQLWWERKLIDGKFDKANIIQTDTIGGTDKVASAEVTKALGQEIDVVLSNLSKIKMVSIVVNPGGLDYVDYQTSGTIDTIKGVIAMNGDIIAAHEINVIGISLVGSDTIRIYFNTTRSGAVRINLLYTLL